MSRLLTTGILQQARNLSHQKQYALSFDGNDYVEINNNGIFDLQLPFTIEIKMVEAIDAIDNSVLLENNQNNGYSIQPYRDTLKINLGGVALPDPSCPRPEKDGLLRMITFTINGIDNNNVYIDGIDNTLVSSTDNLPIYSFQPLYIGSRLGSYGHRGLISDVRIWSIARTQQQIQDNFNKKLTGNEPGLVAYYDFNEGEGNILYDKTPNANHGTIYGATWVEI
jgi:hypothetical protein